MIKRLLVLVSVSTLLLVFARDAPQPKNDSPPSKRRVTAESAPLKEEIESHYRTVDGKKHGYYHKGPDPEPWHDPEPWEEPEPWQDPNAGYDADPWPWHDHDESSDDPDAWHQGYGKPPDPWDPWYQEPDPWHDPDSWEDEPCIPVHSESSKSGVKERPHYPQHSHVRIEEDWDDLEFEEHHFADTDWEKYDAKVETAWWHDQHHAKVLEKKLKGKKAKGPKGTKGKKGSKGKPPRHYKPRPKQPPKHKPKPCPTKAPTKPPTKEPTRAPVGSGSEDPGLPYYKRPPGNEGARPDEVAVSLPFSIQFDVQETRFPTESDIEGLTNTTMDFLQDYFFAAFVTDNEGTVINFLSVDSPADSKVQNDIVYVPLTAILYFSTESASIPSTRSLNFLLMHAFQGDSLDMYHEELTELPDTNVFFSANVMSVLIVNEHDTSNYEEEEDSPNEDTFTENTHDPSHHDDPPLPKEFPTTLTDSRDSNSKSTTSTAPPFTVIAIVSVTIVSMGAFFVHLVRRQQSFPTESASPHQFPPLKELGDGHSVADATIMMQDEGSLVECEIGDDDFSVASSGSTRRSRAENFLRLMEEDDKTSRPRQFLIANASRMGNTWNQQE